MKPKRKSNQHKPPSNSSLPASRRKKDKNADEEGMQLAEAGGFCSQDTPKKQHAQNKIAKQTKQNQDAQVRRVITPPFLHVIP